MHGALLLAAPASWSEDRWHGSVAATTDYIYRGITQTRGQPAIQGGLQLQLPGAWSAGVWGSTIDFTGESSYEIDLHVAHTWSLSPDWSAQLAVTHYDYPDEYLLDYDYDELTATLSFQQRVAASVSWSPNTSRYGDWTIARNRRAIAYELSLLQPLSTHWSLCAGVGHYDLRDLFDAGYWFWSAGLAFQWQAVQVDLLHINTDATAERLFGYEAAGGRWTAALSWRF